MSWSSNPLPSKQRVLDIARGHFSILLLTSSALTLRKRSDATEHSGLAGASSSIYRKLFKDFLKVPKDKTKLQRTLIEAGQYLRYPQWRWLRFLFFHEAFCTAAKRWQPGETFHGNVLMYLSTARAEVLTYTWANKDAFPQCTNVVMISRLQSLILGFLIKLEKNHISKQWHSPRNRILIFQLPLVLP